LPYTPENPDRLLKYAIRVAKENDGEINILRVITVPNQTPLSAGVAFAESAKKAFAPLDKILDKEEVLNHYLVRISHDWTEAILATIEEQRIDLVVTDFETLRTNKKLQTLATCNIIAIHTTGSGMDDVVLSSPANNDNNNITNTRTIAENNNINNNNNAPSSGKKNLVVVYDSGNHSDAVLKVTSWLEHTGQFKVNVLAITDKEKMLRQEQEYQDIKIRDSGITEKNPAAVAAVASEKEKENKDQNYEQEREKKLEIDKNVAKELEKEEFLENVGIEYNRVILTEESERNPTQSARLIMSAINMSNPDIIVTGASIGKFDVFNNQQFMTLIDRLECPVIVAKAFTIPGVSRIQASLMRMLGK
jgi:hypothetical protein